MKLQAPRKYEKGLPVTVFQTLCVSTDARCKSQVFQHSWQRVLEERLCLTITCHNGSRTVPLESPPSSDTHRTMVSNSEAASSRPGTRVFPLPTDSWAQRTKPQPPSSPRSRSRGRTHISFESTGALHTVCSKRAYQDGHYSAPVTCIIGSPVNHQMPEDHPRSHRHTEVPQQRDPSVVFYTYFHLKATPARPLTTPRGKAEASNISGSTVLPVVRIITPPAAHHQIELRPQASSLPFPAPSWSWMIGSVGPQDRRGSTGRLRDFSVAIYFAPIAPDFTKTICTERESSQIDDNFAAKPPVDEDMLTVKQLGGGFECNTNCCHW
jgi:hypothetical protein